MDKKKLTAALMTVAITGSSFTAFADFKDVQDGDLKEKIQALVDAGIVSGKGNGIFDPAGNMKRGELAKVIALALELPLDKAGAEKKFADVKGHWSAPYVGALVKAGITNGVAPNKFNPEGTVTRQELAVFFIRALGLEDEAEGLALLPQYDDAASIAEWAKFEVALAQALGLTAEEGNFGPNVKASRTEMVEYTYASAFAQEEIAQAVEELEKIVADLDDIEAAEAAVKAFVEAKLTTDAEVKAAEELLAKANEAIAKVDTADKKAELQKQVDDQKAKLDDAKVEVAVKAYEDAKLTTLEEVAAAEELGKKAEEAVAKVADAEKKAAFEKRVADQKAKVDAAKAALGTFKVESVSSTNLKQFTVVFNKKVNKDTVVNANFIFNGAALGGTDSVSLGADGKTVTVTLGTAQSQQAARSLVVKNVKDEAGTLVTEFSGTVNFFDATIPSAVAAKVVGPQSIEIEFSEPINGALLTNAAFSIDNNTYSLTGVPSVSGNKVTITTGATLPVGAHKVTINPTAGAVSNVVDFAGFQAPKTDVSFEYAVDTKAPVASIGSVTQTTVTINFDKPVTLAGVLNTDFTVYHTYNNIANYKGNATLSADGKSMTVTFAAPMPAGNVTLFLNNSTTSSLQLKDNWGNAFASTTLTATVTADVTAPTVTEVKFIDANNIDVTFSEAVTGVATTDFTLKNSAGSTIVINSVTNTTGNTYRINTATALNGDTYTLSIADKSITDTSVNANAIAAYTHTLTVADTAAPTVTAASFSADSKKVFLYFSEKMATTGTGSVLDVANYRLASNTGTNPSTLPSGTTITLGADGKSVIITFPSAVAGLGAGNYASVLVGQVKDLAGNSTVALSNLVNLTTADVTTANISNIKATGTNTITFEVNSYLSAINVSNFQINGVAATSASYVNADGKSVVTVVAPTGNAWGTDKTGLNANAVVIAAGGLTNDQGVSNTAPITLAAGNVADYIAPSIQSRTIADTDADGLLDQIVVTFSEPLQVASVAYDAFTVEGYTVNNLVTSGNTVTLTLAEKSVSDLTARPKVQLVKPVRDNSPQFNTLNAESTGTAVTAAVHGVTGTASVTTQGVTAVAGVDTLTFSAGWAAGDTLVIDGVTLTAVAGVPAADQFDVTGDNPVTIAASVKAAVDANATLSAKYNVTDSGTGVLTFTQKAGQESATALSATATTAGAGDAVAANTTAGVAAQTEVATLTVTTGASANGSVAVTINGATTYVAVLATDTAVDVATKIAAAVSVTGYTVAAVANTVTFTANTPGAQTDLVITLQ